MTTTHVRPDTGAWTDVALGDGAAPDDAPAPPAGAAGGRGLTTFDVFETLLVRAVSPHQAVFDLVGERGRERGLVACSAYAFGRVREAAERRAARTNGDRTTLADVYVEVGEALALSETDRDALAALEMEVEAGLLRPVPSARPLLAAARERAGRAVFVSDMYLPHAFIEAQLRRHGLWEAGDALYVSQTHGHKKGSGRLFHIVAETEGVPASALHHVGNSPWADVAGAERAGVRATLLGAGNPNRYEAALGRHRHATDGRTGAFAGASRLARLHVEAGTAHDRALVEVAAGVAAPTLTAYVLWVLRRAEALGLRRLYFASRDGQVLFRIARRLTDRLGLDLDLRYLYASRATWNRAVASPTEHPEVWRSLVWKSVVGISNRDILERTGIGEAAVARAVAASGAGDAAWASTGSRAVLHEALRQLDADGTLAASAAEARRLLLRYLDAEGLFDGVPHAFVDVGWRATQHDVVVALQEERGVAPARGLFFGLDPSESPYARLREGYFYDARREGGGFSDKRFNRIFEVFCAGDHGTVLDYEEAGGEVRPVLAEGRGAEVAAWGLPTVWETVDAYVDHLDLDLAALHADVRAALRDAVDLFRRTPTRAEAEAWGRFPWELGQGRRIRSVELAPPHTLAGLARKVAERPMRIARPGRLLLSLRTEWTDATAERSGGLMRQVYLWRGGGDGPRRLRELVKARLRPLKRALGG